MKYALDLSGALIRNFSPLTITFLNSQGGTLQERAISAVKTVTPSPLQPIADIATNVNWLGSQNCKTCGFY